MCKLGIDAAINAITSLVPSLLFVNTSLDTYGQDTKDGCETSANGRPVESNNMCLTP